MFLWRRGRFGVIRECRENATGSLFMAKIVPYEPDSKQAVLQEYDILKSCITSASWRYMRPTSRPGTWCSSPSAARGRSYSTASLTGVCVCVCGERVSVSTCVCACVRGSMSVSVCVCVCVRERERVCKW